jgi:hypothetical protein
MPIAGNEMTGLVLISFTIAVLGGNAPLNPIPNMVDLI